MNISYTLGYRLLWHILMSPVINYWTDMRPHGIYLLDKARFAILNQLAVVFNSMFSIITQHNF